MTTVSKMLPLHLGTGSFCPEQWGHCFSGGHVSTGPQSADSTSSSWVPLTRHGSFWVHTKVLCRMGLNLTLQRTCKYLKECWSGLIVPHTVSVPTKRDSKWFLFSFFVLSISWLVVELFFLCSPHTGPPPSINGLGKGPETYQSSSFTKVGT